MCLTEQTDEEIVQEAEAVSEKPVLEEEAEKVSVEKDSEEEPDFNEGVENLEDIPKGKEKDYGI